MLKKIWEKLCGIGRWFKRQWKKIAVIITGTVLIAQVLPTPINEVSLEKFTQKYNASTEIQAEYQIDGASLKKVNIKNPELDKYKGEPKDEIKITIGEKDNPNFVPNIEIKRWNEVSFKIKPDLEGIDVNDMELEFEDNKIKFKTPEMEFEFEDFDEEFKFIWTLNSKPADRTICFDMESSGLDFFYQPALTLADNPDADYCIPTASMPPIQQGGEQKEE